MSPGLKNLVSNAAAVGEETPSPTKSVNTSPGTGAPTLTRLLELPLNSPGKPLPELTVGEEAEVSTASSPSKIEIRTQEEEASPGLVEETVTTAPSESASDVVEMDNKDEEKPPADVEDESVPPAEPEVELKSEKESEKKEAEETAAQVEPSAGEQRESAKDSHEEMSVAFESEVEVSHNDVDQHLEETVVEPASVPKSEPGEEEESVVKEENDKDMEDELDFAEGKAADKGELLKSPEADTSMSKPDAGTPTLTRRPLRGMRRNKHGQSRKEDDKSKAAADLGPTTRRNSGRKGNQADEDGDSFGEPADVTPSSSKKKAPPPPLYIPSPSPAPSSGIDSTPNSPTSSVSTVK